MEWHLNYGGVKMYYEEMHEGLPMCRSRFYVILKDKSLSANFEDYEFWFNFDKELNCKEIFEIAEWCDENLEDNYLVGINTSGFEHKTDAMAFRLRWC